MADRVTFRLRGVTRRRDDRDEEREYIARARESEAFDTRPGRLLSSFPASLVPAGYRANNRAYLETNYRSVHNLLRGFPQSDSAFYKLLWERIARDWRLFSVQQVVNDFGTQVYLPLRRAVRGFSRRWRARNQWRMGIAGIPFAISAVDVGNPRIGRRPQGGESGIY